MEGIFAAIQVEALTRIGGWMTLAAFVIIFARLLWTGTLLTAGQHKALIETIRLSAAAQVEDVKASAAAQIAEVKATAERQRVELEEHLDAILALKRAAYDDAYAHVKEAYEARLTERDELLDEARENVREMVQVARTYGDQMTAIAHTSEVVERVVLGLDEALKRRRQPNVPE